MTSGEARGKDALTEAELLARLPVEISFSALLRTLPPRAKEALAVCSLVSGALVLIAVRQLSSAGGVMGAASVGAAAYLVYIAGAKTAHVSRWRTLRRKLKVNDPSIVDLVAFAAPSAVAAPGRARVAVAPSIRLHDSLESAVLEAQERLEVPAWWASSKPEARDVFFDGSRFHRTGPHVPSGVLLELVVDGPGRIEELPAGTPVRVVGDERCAVLMTVRSTMWPRGRWLAGG